MSGSENREGRALRIAIIGAGPGGLATGVRLRQRGFDDFVIFEKAEGLGGTWFHNRYPGCACDIPSHLYSFSFAVNREWSRPYASQPEILAYLEGIANEHELWPHLRLSCAVEKLVWDDANSRWSLGLESGETESFDVVVSAIGMFNELAWPDIPGRESFCGTSFHSARWNWNHDLSGERVGVIGSAASAVQFVPEIAQHAAQVHLFQRTANWVMPKEDTPFDEQARACFRADPAAVEAVRQEIYDQVDGGMTFDDPARLAEMEAACLESMTIVVDPAVRAKLRPDHPFGCKRPLLSNDYYPVFNRKNLELVTEGIERITEDAIVAVDGKTRVVDTIVYATGFAATKYLSALDVTGRGGIHIDEAWRDGARAYLGIATCGFPNLFMLYGPNTNNGSLLTMIEAQVDYVLQHVERISRENLAWVDVRPEPMERFNEAIQRAIGEVKVWQESCNGYYRTPTGRIVTQWPHSMTAFIEQTASLDESAFDVARR